MIGVFMIVATLAVPDSLINADEIRSFDTFDAAKNSGTDLVAFAFPAVENAGNPCCYQLPGGRRGCTASSDKHYGLTIHNTKDLDAITRSAVWVQSVDNPDTVWTISLDCPFDASGHSIAWVDVTPAQSFAILADAARSNEDSALSLALHADPRGTAILRSLAANKNHGAAFWLGEFRGEQGLNALFALMQERPDEDYLAAIAQSDLTEAVDALSNWSRSTGRLRHQARFWLAQRAPDAAYPLLMDVLQTEADEESVFALSQLPDSLATPALLELVRGDYPKPIRRQALFWLAESDDPDAIDALTAMLE